MPDLAFGGMALPLNPIQPQMFPTPQPQQRISADEIALYDRQLCLWGMAVQEKLRRANTLLIGIEGLGSELQRTWS